MAPLPTSHVPQVLPTFRSWVWICHANKLITIFVAVYDNILKHQNYIMSQLSTATETKHLSAKSTAEGQRSVHQLGFCFLHNLQTHII